jgi:hypothetical protein
MNTKPGSTLTHSTVARSSALLAALMAASLAACNQSPAPTTPPAATTPAANSAPETVLGKSVAAALRKAREELETSNIDLDNGIDVRTGTNGHHFRIGHATDGSRAQITPQGDLLIEGKAVPVTPAQRALVLEYRRGIIGVAEAGMNIGVKGADLAGKAMLETFSGLMHGNADQAGKHIEAEGKRLEADAKQICAQLPSLLDSQQRLAASLPAFKPYATMTQADIDDCMKDDGASVTAADRAEIRDEIRSRIREGIRGSIQGGTSESKPATATTGDNEKPTDAH